MEQRITIDTIYKKEFHMVAKGYDHDEVDEFLDLICDELELREKEVADLKAQLEYANAAVRKAEAGDGFARPAEKPAAAPQPSAASSATELLEMAQTLKQQIIENAEARAKEIIENAQVDAAARLGGLLDEQKALEESVAGLKDAEKTCKANLAKLVEDCRAALDTVGSLFGSEE